jgi:predicted LPLAT superfamily acyltransferase
MAVAGAYLIASIMAAPVLLIVVLAHKKEWPMGLEADGGHRS